MVKERKSRGVGKVWGSYTENQADTYYDKFNLQCATREEYRNWFVHAERANTPCRTLSAFCGDCLLAYELRQTAAGTCVKNRKDDPAESYSDQD